MDSTGLKNKISLSTTVKIGIFSFHYNEEEGVEEKRGLFMNEH